jgi:hypothetical protein
MHRTKDKHWFSRHIDLLVIGLAWILINHKTGSWHQQRNYISPETWQGSIRTLGMFNNDTFNRLRISISVFSTFGYWPLFDLGRSLLKGKKDTSLEHCYSIAIECSQFTVNYLAKNDGLGFKLIC